MNYRYILDRTSTPCSEKQSDRCGLSPFGVKTNGRNISWKLTQTSLKSHLKSFQVIFASARSFQKALLSRCVLPEELQVAGTYADRSSERRGRRKSVSGLVTAPGRKNVPCRLSSEGKGVHIHFHIPTVKNKNWKCFENPAGPC